MSEYCQKCADCCKYGYTAWIEYFLRDIEELGKAGFGGVDLSPKLRKQLYQFCSEANTLVSKIFKTPPNYTLSRGNCAMLIRKKDKYYCKLHRVGNFGGEGYRNRKPIICKNHKCYRLRNFEEKQNANKKGL